METTLKAMNLADEVSYGYGERLARVIKYKYGSDLDPYVEQIRGKVHYSTDIKEDDLRVSGSIVVKKDATFDIYLPSFTGRLRDRFTIAHELGHYCLHFDFGKKSGSALRFGRGQIEWEANCFAAGFLMPEKEFRDYFENGASDTSLAARFQVSFDAVKIRRGLLDLKRTS